jgi:type 1 glutamine amidotransferase
MTRFRFAAVLAVFLLSRGVCAAAAAAADGAGKHPLKVAMYSGSAEYRSAESLAGLKKHLEAEYGTSCSLHVVDEKGTKLTGIEDLEACDVAVIFTRRLKLDEGQVAALKKYCDAGKPVVGIRTASHAFQTWLEFDRDVLGGNYQGHYREDAPAAVKPVAAGHPLLEGVKPFTTKGKLYKNPDLARDVTRLLTATTPETTETVAWTRQHKGGRVFYTSLGTPEDFENPDFRRLVVNAIFWTANRETPVPAGK